MSNLYGLTFQLEEPTPNKPTKVINIMVDEEGEKYINYLHQELQQKENVIKEVKSQLDYLETYSSREDVFEDMKRRLDRIESIVNKEEK